MIVTIHQPDMLPWLGFFNKINKADMWVILDHTYNNPRDAAFWGRRVKILVNGQGKWLSLPLIKPEDPTQIGVPINEMRFNMANGKVYTDSLRTVELAYRKTLYFNDIFPLVERFFKSEEPLMAKRNLAFILDIMKMLHINTGYKLSSELGCTLQSTDLLVEIVNKMKGEVYLCGGGAAGYQEDAKFARKGIGLEYNNFSHPVYQQRGVETFVPGLSVIDVLMHVGVERTTEMLHSKH